MDDNQNELLLDPQKVNEIMLSELNKAGEKRGHKIFLDLKAHDIPATVEKAMKNLAELDIDMTNIHAASDTSWSFWRGIASKGRFSCRD